MSGDHADDAARLGADADELHHRIGPHQPAVDGVHVRKHPLRQALADDDHLLAVAPIAVVEIAAGDDRHAERGEEARRDRAEPRPRILFAVRLARSPPTVNCAAKKPASRHGTTVPTATLLDAGQLRDAPDRFLVEARRSLRGFRVYDTTGTFTASTLRVLKPVCCRCSANSVVRSMPAPASSTNDAAICVTANTRRRRLVPVVMRTLPFDRPNAVRRLRPTAGAARTPAEPPRPRASTTPTQSRLASTVTSSARTEKRAA